MTDTNDWFAPESTTFGDRLAGAREAAGLTQAELARRLGVKTKTMRAWEEDLAEPRANRLQMLAGLLNVSLGWLLSGVGEGVPGPTEEVDLTPDLKDILTEMRSLRAEMARNADRLARLEKRLRKSLETPL
jgi:transcriptional regulator with XRE-family HTH domain